MLRIARRVGAAALVAISGLALVSTQAQAQLGLGSLIVTMTSPDSGSTVSGTVPVSASVSIIGLITVRGVQFRLDGANLGGEDTNSPYSVSWNTTGSGNGSHTLTAVARDLLGVQYTSNPVTVTVSNAAPPPPPPPADTTPPTVRITSPSDGQTISGTVTIRASASDNVGVVGVQFQLDGVNGSAEEPSDSYSILFDTTTTNDGSHTITAVAPDAAGNRSISAPVTVTVANAPPPPPGDTTPPTVSITAPVNGATISGTVTVEASASDNVGVAGVQFQLDGANAGAEDTAAPYSISFDTTITSNGSHPITAVARDAAGNRTTSAPVTVRVANNAPPPPPPPGSTQRFEETDPSVAYTAGWSPEGSLSWSGGTAAFSATAGAQATFTFTGPSVTWIGGRSANTGIARISLDGAFLTEVDTFSKTLEVRVSMFEATGLANTRHTLTIEATGRQNAAAMGALVFVDAFDVPASTVSRLQETDPSIAYSAGSFVAPDWMPFDSSRAWSAGLATLSTVTGAKATITFDGTGIRWIGARGPQCGIARISLDGAFVEDFDTYFETEGPQHTDFFRSGLAPGTHTLSIQVINKNPLSSDFWILIDAFDVIP